MYASLNARFTECLRCPIYSTYSQTVNAEIVHDFCILHLNMYSCCVFHHHIHKNVTRLQTEIFAACTERLFQMLLSGCILILLLYTFFFFYNFCFVYFWKGCENVFLCFTLLCSSFFLSFFLSFIF
jgi:hypothetical protein